MYTYIHCYYYTPVIRPISVWIGTPFSVEGRRIFWACLQMRLAQVRQTMRRLLLPGRQAGKQAGRQVSSAAQPSSFSPAAAMPVETRVTVVGAHTPVRRLPIDECN